MSTKSVQKAEFEDQLIRLEGSGLEVPVELEIVCSEITVNQGQMRHFDRIAVYRDEIKVLEGDPSPGFAKKGEFGYYFYATVMIPMFGSVKKTLFGSEIVLDRHRSSHTIRIAFHYRDNEVYSSNIDIDPVPSKEWMKEKRISLDPIRVECSIQQLSKAALRFGN